MDFSFTPEQERFRQEIRGFLRQELTPEFRRQLEEEAGEEWQLRGHSPEFSRKLGQKGWIGLAWPKEYGGQGLGYIERLIYDEEMALAEAPNGYKVRLDDITRDGRGGIFMVLNSDDEGVYPFVMYERQLLHLPAYGFQMRLDVVALGATFTRKWVKFTLVNHI